MGTGPILVERFEVPDAEAPAFDAWLDGPHLDGATALSGVLRVRTMTAYRDMPHRFPHDRYLGKGNRMIWLDLDPASDLRAFVREPGVRAWLEASIGWDLRLPYVRREVAEHLLTRTREQALEARHG